MNLSYPEITSPEKSDLIYSALKSFCDASTNWHNATCAFSESLTEESIHELYASFDKYTEEFHKYNSTAKQSYIEMKSFIDDENILQNVEFFLRNINAYYKAYNDIYVAKMQLEEMKSGNRSLIEKYMLMEAFLNVIYKEMLHLQMSLIANRESIKDYIKMANRYLRKYNISKQPIRLCYE